MPKFVSQIFHHCFSGQTLDGRLGEEKENFGSRSHINKSLYPFVVTNPASPRGIIILAVHSHDFDLQPWIEKGNSLKSLKLSQR